MSLFQFELNQKTFVAKMGMKPNDLLLEASFRDHKLKLLCLAMDTLDPERAVGIGLAR